MSIVVYQEMKEGEDGSHTVEQILQMGANKHYRERHKRKPINFLDLDQMC